MTTIAKKRISLSVGAQMIYAMIAVVCAVALPAILHTVGSVTGLGTALGESLLPMHLPIMAVGFFAGPVAGAVAGIASPIISFLLTGMPMAGILPFFIIETCVYGVASGLLAKVETGAFVKTLAAQLAGRAVRAVAILTAVYLFDYGKIGVNVIWNSIVTGLPGIILQLAVLPMMLIILGKKQNS